MRHFPLYAAILFLLWLVSCKDDKVQRAQVQDFNDLGDQLVSLALRDADSIILSRGYSHISPQSPFNIGYNRADTSFIFLLTDSATNLIVASQRRERKTTPAACLKTYAEFSAANHLKSWSFWQGSITLNQTTTSFTNYTEFFTYILSLQFHEDSTITAFQIDEQCQSTLMQSQISATPIQQSSFAVIYTLNMKN